MYFWQIIFYVHWKSDVPANVSFILKQQQQNLILETYFSFFFFFSLALISLTPIFLAVRNGRKDLALFVVESQWNCKKKKKSEVVLHIFEEENYLQFCGNSDLSFQNNMCAESTKDCVYDSLWSVSATG